MGIFSKKQSFPRPELKSVFRKDRGIIPRTGGRRYSRGEREGLVKDVFGTKYGSQISKQDYSRAIKDLERTRRATKTLAEKRNIERKTNYLRRLAK